MNGTSQTFDWGVFLTCIGIAALLVLAILTVLLRRLGAMSARLVQTTAVVEVMEGPLAEAAEQLTGLAGMRPLQYRYQVAGQSFVGSLATLQPGAADRSAAEAGFAVHRPGDIVTVFYDRSHPSRSVIDGRAPAVPAWVRHGWLPAAAALLIGIVMMVLGQ